MAASEKPGLLRRGLRRLARTARSSRAPVGPSAVRFEPEGRPAVEARVEAGTTLLQAAIANGVDVSHYCGGTCSCGTCRVTIREGADSLSPIDGREQMVLGYEAMRAGERLACQARVSGPVTVRVLDRY